MPSLVETVLASPAQSLGESAQQLRPDPLLASDPRYTSLDAGRATSELSELEAFLKENAQTPDAYAKCAFVGGRGSGKSTYLLHLERRLKEEGLFTPIHIYLDPSLRSDCDYSDLFLWMVDEIASQFKALDHPVDAKALSAVTLWFAEKTHSQNSEWKKEIGLSTEASASMGGSIPLAASFKVLARLKSMIVGSETSRKEIRQSVQNYANELRDRMNDFLDHARGVLKKAGKPTRLLIVQDDLDRLAPREKAQHFFENGGDMLMSLRADIIYTAPLALHLAPLNIRQTFGTVFTMPNVKVKLRNGKPHKPGVDALVALVGKRLAIPLVFESEKVVRFLAEKSGGSIRDLIRLVGIAQLKATVANKQRVDMVSAKAAVKKMTIEFMDFLLPGNAYYPILADIHLTKREFGIREGESPTQQSVSDALVFFANLIGNGSVLQYNGDDSWYDVHPAVCEIEGFQHVLAKASAQNQTPQA